MRRGTNGAQMSDTGYKPDDPWHAWVNLCFALSCTGCGASIDVDWSQVHDGGNDDFLIQCVAVSDRAQQEGWRHLGGSAFLCGRCATARAARPGGNDDAGPPMLHPNVVDNGSEDQPVSRFWLWCLAAAFLWGVWGVIVLVAGWMAVRAR